MNIQHHPDDSTLLSYAAGSLPEAFAIVVSCHLQSCDICRQRIAEAETLGAELVASTAPVATTERDRFMALLEREPANISYLDRSGLDAATSCHTLPPPLDKLLELAPEKRNDLPLPWHKLSPGIEEIRLDTSDQNLSLLKIDKGVKTPVHSHYGSEMTLVLHGGYSDALGEFGPGDVADLDHSTEHQPATDDDICICLAATDAPLKFRNLWLRLLQKVMRF